MADGCRWMCVSRVSMWGAREATTRHRCCGGARRGGLHHHQHTWCSAECGERRGPIGAKWPRSETIPPTHSPATRGPRLASRSLVRRPGVRMPALQRRNWANARGQLQEADQAVFQVRVRNESRPEFIFDTGEPGSKSTPMFARRPFWVLLSEPLQPASSRRRGS